MGLYISSSACREIGNTVIVTCPMRPTSQENFLKNILFYWPKAASKTSLLHNLITLVEWMLGFIMQAWVPSSSTSQIKPLCSWIKINLIYWLKVSQILSVSPPMGIPHYWLSEVVTGSKISQGQSCLSCEVLVTDILNVSFHMYYTMTEVICLFIATWFGSNCTFFSANIQHIYSTFATKSLLSILK